MSTQLNNSGFDTGSNYQFADKMIKPNYPRSLFDDSHLVTRDISQAGLVVPLSVMEALPASDYEINISWLVRMLPQAVPLMSRQRIYFYAFYSRCADLWTGFDSFIRRGYSGNEIKTVPVVPVDSNFPGSLVPTNPQWSSDSGVLPGSLGDFFGLPLAAAFAASGSTNINALPFMMYLRIWRDYFMNRNYFYSDRNLLPDDDADFRLDDNGNVKSFASRGSDFDFENVFFDVEGAFSAGVTTSSPYSIVSSRGMTYIDYTVDNDDYHTFVVAPFYHDYPSDYFVSALPWPQRGNTPTLDLGTVNFSLDRSSLTDLILDDSSVGGATEFGFKVGSVGDTSPVGIYTFGVGSSRSNVSQAVNSGFNRWLGDSLVNGASSSFSSDVTLESLRSLAVSQTIMEKMARTDGSYYEFGLTFYGEPSKAAYDYRPTFIGGCTGDIVFTEVLQTSQSSSQSPLGQQAGHGISGNSGYLGRFHSDDYGYIMIMCCIMPDVYYSQGLDKMWSRLNQADWFLPERSLLGMQPILNKELFLQSETVVDDDGNKVNDNLWAYQDIFDEYRYQKNRIGGQVADSTKLSFFPFTQSRKFSTLPNWGREFASSDDVRTDYLASKIESPYIGQFDVNVRAVKPLPYQARPSSILNGLA